MAVKAWGGLISTWTLDKQPPSKVNMMFDFKVGICLQRDTELMKERQSQHIYFWAEKSLTCSDVSHVVIYDISDPRGNLSTLDWCWYRLFPENITEGFTFIFHFQNRQSLHAVSR